MLVIGNSLKSSFEHTYEIKRNQYMLTVMSGSSGFGGHASMFLEHLTSNLILESAETEMIHLTTPGGGMCNINVEELQYVVIHQDGQAEVVDTVYENLDTNQDFTKMPTGDLQGKHIRKYPINNTQRDALKRAIEKFSGKLGKGRYVYSYPGGGLGRVFSGIGKRGLNCADFVIKILNDSGIGHRYTGLITTPKRVSKLRH